MSVRSHLLRSFHRWEVEQWYRQEPRGGRHSVKEREALKRRTLELRCWGRSGRRICRNLGMSEATLARWLKADTIFRLHYEEARRLYLETLYQSEHRKGMRRILRNYQHAVDTGLSDIFQKVGRDLRQTDDGDLPDPDLPADP